MTDDASCDGGEASLGRYLIDTSHGHRLLRPAVFPRSAFRHRCFLVTRGNTTEDLATLEGEAGRPGRLAEQWQYLDEADAAAGRG